MASWDGKTKGGTLGYKIFIFLLKILPVRVSYFILRFVVFWYFCFADKKGISFYFRKIHQYSFFKTQLAIYKNFFVFGQVLLDRIAILGGFSKRFSFCFEGEEYLHQMARDKTGGVLIGAHIGNWEIAGQLLERIDTKIHVVMYDGEQNHIKELMSDVIVKKNIGIINIKENDSSYLVEIAEALKNKHIIAMHGDRFLEGANTVTTSFLGYPAELPSGPFYLASKYRVPVVYVSAMKESSLHYHFYASKPKYFRYPAKLANRKSELKKMVDDYVAEMEKIILKYPLQWFNYYPFWKNN